MAVSRTTRVALFVAISLGLLAAVAMIFVAYVHNPSNEFYGASWSEPQALILLGAVVACAIGAVTFPICWAILRAIRKGS
jgi:uncharacterized integral membrane protein